MSRRILRVNVSICGDVQTPDKHTKKNALCALVMGRLHGTELLFTCGILFHRVERKFLKSSQYENYRTHPHS